MIDKAPLDWVRFGGKMQIRISTNRKTDTCDFGANSITDHRSIKSTLRVDFSDQIQSRIFEIHNLSVFFFFLGML